jgi:hypothetical protein
MVQVAAASSTSEEGAVPATVKAVTAVVPAVIVSPADGATALVSAEVDTEKFDAPYVPAAPLITETVRVAAVEVASIQVPVLVLRLTVTTLSTSVSTPVPVQSVANSPVPVGVLSAMAGAALDVVKPEGNVTVIELPDARAPDGEVVNPTVQVDAVFSTNDVGAVPVKVTPESDVAPAPETVDNTVNMSTANDTVMKAKCLARTPVEPFN